MSTYLTPDEIAATLRVAGKTVRLWCRTGQLKATKVGKQWRITPADLSNFMKSNHHEVQNEAKKVDGLALAH